MAIRGSVPLCIHDSIPARSQLLSCLEPAELTAPVEDVLDELCERIGELLSSQVVSVYALEPGQHDSLLMRGNVGLAADAVGNLRLSVGDGIVGWVAECMRPISLGTADRDPRFKSVRGIGEEEYPVIFAQPLVRRGRCIGVLMVQRAERPFDASEITLAQVLAEATALVLEAAARQRRNETSGTESVCLLGRSLTGGLAMGRVELIPTCEALGGEPPPDPTQVAEAFDRVARDIHRLREQLPKPIDPTVSTAIDQMNTLVSDSRLRNRALAGGDLVEVARAYARVPAQLAGDGDRLPYQRAEQVGELCTLLHLIASRSKLLHSGRIWLGRRFGSFFALAAARTASAVVLDDGGDATDDALAIADACRLPLLSGVRGLFAWTKPGDLLVVDADRSIVRVNPSSSGIVAVRSAKKRRLS